MYKTDNHNICTLERAHDVSYITDLKPIDDIRNIIISDIVSYSNNSKGVVSETCVTVSHGEVETVYIMLRFFNKGMTYVEYAINNSHIKICHADRTEYVDLMNYSKVAVAIKTARVIIGGD